MTRTLPLFALSLVLTLPARADDPATAGAAARGALEVVSAIASGDYPAVVDRTVDAAVTDVGGRDQAIAALRDGIANLRKRGATIRNVGVGTPGAPATEGTNTFVVVPTTLELGTPQGRLLARSYLLGVSPDAGKTWKYVEGAAVGDPAVRAKLLPKLPPALKLPRIAAPEPLPAEKPPTTTATTLPTTRPAK
ncbi:MAG: hypothetical protein ACAI43_09375 [Phycisphaerae bacterium]